MAMGGTREGFYYIRACFAYDVRAHHIFAEENTRPSTSQHGSASHRFFCERKSELYDLFLVGLQGNVQKIVCPMTTWKKPTPIAEVPLPPIIFQGHFHPLPHLSPRSKFKSHASSIKLSISKGQKTIHYRNTMRKEEHASTHQRENTQSYNSRDLNYMPCNSTHAIWKVWCLTIGRFTTCWRARGIS